MGKDTKTSEKLQLVIAHTIIEQQITKRAGLRRVTPATIARLKAGYTLEEAARKLKLTPEYLRQIERKGQASFKTSQRIARLYGCSGNLFLYSTKYLTHPGPEGATGTSDASVTVGVDTRDTSRANRHTQSSTNSPAPPSKLPRKAGGAR